MTMTSAADLGSNRHLLCSQRLRERRRDLGLTQKQVITRLARLGVASTNKALSSLEHGSGLDVAKLPELAVALECSVTWLLGLTDEPRSWEPTGAYAPRRRGAAAGPSRSAARSVDGSGWSGRSGAGGLPRILGPLSDDG